MFITLTGMYKNTKLQHTYTKHTGTMLNAQVTITPEKGQTISKHNVKQRETYTQINLKKTHLKMQ